MSKRKPNPAPIDTDRARETKRENFLRALESGNTYTKAAKIAGVPTSTIHAWRRDDALFAYEVLVAMHSAAEPLIEKAHELAFKGVRKYKFEKGRPQMWFNPQTGELEHYFEVYYDTNLLIILLKAYVPFMFCDSTRSAEINRVIAKLEGDGSGAPAAAKLDEIRRLLDTVATNKRDGGGNA